MEWMRNLPKCGGMCRNMCSNMRGNMRNGNMLKMLKFGEIHRMMRMGEGKTWQAAEMENGKGKERLSFLPLVRRLFSGRNIT